MTIGASSGPRVCIVGLKCFDQIAGAAVPRYLGGIETQLAILAKGLVREGCEVSLITYDHGEPDGQVFDGVRVFKSFNPGAGGIPLIRWFQRSACLVGTIRRANADIYVQMGAGAETGQVAFARRRAGKAARFVYCLASDGDYGALLRAGKFGWEGKLYQYGLRQADLIVSQTLGQQEGLRKALGLNSEVVPMAVVPVCAPLAKHLNGSSRVLWVGRITREKRLEWLMEAARRFPSVAFDVVGSPNKDSDYAVQVLRNISLLPNVTAHGRLSDGALRDVYQRATLLCCTSVLEGFPTTFLEAWSCGLPVVTTFDPDGLVSKCGLGLVATTESELVLRLGEVLGNDAAYSRISASAREYYLANHRVDIVSRRFREVFDKLLG